MSHRYIAGTLLAASLLIVLFSYLAYHHPDVLGLCNRGERCLGQDMLFGTVQPLNRYAGLLPPLFLLLVFVRREVFFVWLKLFGVFFVIAVLLAIEAVPVSHDFFPGLPTRPQVLASMIKLGVGMSMLIIAIAYLQLFLRKRKLRA